jgi:hypothetical protein
MSECKNGNHLGSTIYKGKCVYCSVDESNRLQKLIPQAWKSGMARGRDKFFSLTLKEWKKQKGLT